MTLALGLVANLGWTACSRHKSHIYALPADKKVHLISFAPGRYQRGTDALVINCETDLSIEDRPGLRQEANEVWKIYRSNAERFRLKYGVVRLLHIEVTGSVTQSQSLVFTFARRGDGWWQRLPDEHK